jgi:hypothetical protein
MSSRSLQSTLDAAMSGPRNQKRGRDKATGVRPWPFLTREFKKEIGRTQPVSGEEIELHDPKTPSRKKQELRRKRQVKWATDTIILALLTFFVL